LPSTSTDPSFATVAVITTGVAVGALVEVGAFVEVGADGCAEGVTVAFDDPHAASVINAKRPSTVIFISVSKFSAPRPRDTDQDVHEFNRG
jgi:hypothetical protein